MAHELTRTLPFFGRFLATAVSLTIAAGCTVGPEYHAPPTTMPTAYQPAAVASESEPALTDWWRQLQDPVLAKLIASAGTYNLDVQTAEARLREARALRRVAASALWPQSTAQTGYAHSRLSQTTDFPPAAVFENGLFPVEQNLYQGGFDASWELDLFGRTRRSVQAADARIHAAADDRRDVLLSVLAETARNYVELRGAQRRLAFAESNIDLQSRTLKLVQEKRSKGVATDLDVSQAAAQFEQTQAVVPELRASIRAGAYRIAVLTGQPPAALLNDLLAAEPLPGAPDIVPVGLPSDLLRRRPDLRRAERELAAATADIGVAVADLYPRFSLTGAASLQAARFTDLFQADSAAWSAGPSITWPVFQGGRIKANIAVSEARRDEALSTYRQKVLLALEDVEGSLVRYAQRQIACRQLTQARQDQARAADLARLQYQRGTRDLLTLLDAQRRLNEIDDKLASSQTAALDDLISLYKALGGGWEAFDRPSPETASVNSVPAPSEGQGSYGTTRRP